MPRFPTRREVHECLNDADFPATKDYLVQTALRHGCEDTAHALRGIPPVSYENMSQVLASVPLADDELDPADKAEAHRIRKPRVADSAKEVPPNPIKEELGENRDS
jgi:hypothetical protein